MSNPILINLWVLGHLRRPQSNVFGHGYNLLLGRFICIASATTQPCPQLWICCNHIPNYRTYNYCSSSSHQTTNQSWLHLTHLALQ